MAPTLREHASRRSQVGQLGDLGAAPRRFFYGPGIENFDMALMKNVPLGGSKALQVHSVRAMP